jgi:hypothetical protein
VPASSILAGTTLLIRPAAVALSSVAVRRRLGVTLAPILPGTTVGA